ncbi:hypothetical protein V1281_004737 [Nitrobacteraceae bacterium AZCC 2161]
MTSVEFEQSTHPIGSVPPSGVETNLVVGFEDLSGDPARLAEKLVPGMRYRSNEAIPDTAPSALTVVPHPNGARAQRRIDYDAYINSAAWRSNRQLELDASGNRCRGCNRGAGEIELQVHHRTYENFGNEAPGDLTTLCIECHPAITDVVRRRRYAGRAPVIGDFASANCTVALFDPQIRGVWA